nr:hypothetical protein CFP56_62108 [Quercus suber]
MSFVTPHSSLLRTKLEDDAQFASTRRKYDFMAIMANHAFHGTSGEARQSAPLHHGRRFRTGVFQTMVRGYGSIH